MRWATYGALGAGLSATGYGRFVEPWWLDYSRTPVAIANLPPGLDGLRIAQLTDFHHHPVSLEEIDNWVDKANHLGADLIVLVGDYITTGRKAKIEDVAAVLKNLKAPLGVVACLGNHDYGTAYPNGDAEHLVQGRRAKKALEDNGIQTLVNEFATVEYKGATLHLAGLGDLWSRDFKADFLETVPGRPLVVLAHNPDTLYSLKALNFDLMLSGHTHGGQVQFPFLGPPRLPIEHRHLAEGHFTFNNNCQIYVSRGLGYLTPVRFRSRPEMGIIELKKA